MPAFPLFKLVGTLVKIGAKPLANRVKISAKNSPKVQAIARWSVLMPFSAQDWLYMVTSINGRERTCEIPEITIDTQEATGKLSYMPILAKPENTKYADRGEMAYHRWDVYYRTKLIGVKSDSANIKPLTDEMAVEEGANIISESIIYLTPLIIFFADYYYTKAKTRNKEEDQVQYLKSLERRIQEMELKEEQHFAQYRELQRFCSSMFQDCEKMVKEKTR